MDDLQKEVMAVLNQLPDRVSDSLDKTAEATAKEAVKKLKETSPKGHSGRYAKGWAVKRTKKGEVYVYNKTDYQLTHLLENGHDIISKSGAKVGEAKAQPHIKPVEEWVQQDFPQRFEREVKLQG
jgi:hypothetical protein